MIVEEKSITGFLDKEYKDYSMYVVEDRAIPSVIDGLKPTQRKVIFVANKIWKSGREKPLKIFQLGGKVASDAFYHHGDGSLNGAIIGLAQAFKNSMPLLSEKGQFGTLRSPEAGAPRYISTSLHDNFRLLYKDFELLGTRHEEGCEIEPPFFLPIVPTVLLNGAGGIAVGFATNILNRNPIEIIDACRAVLNGQSVKELVPWYRGFDGKVIKDPESDNRYLFNGVYEITNTTTVKISELPPGVTYQKYEEHLNKLQEAKKISTYDDNCSSNVDYTVKFTRSALEGYRQRNSLGSLLKMQEKKSDNLTTLDENGKLKIFSNPQELVEYFVKFRLGYYKKRKDYIIDELKKEINLLTNKAAFIKGIIEEKIKVRKIPKAKIEEQLTTLKFDTINGTYSYLLSMAIHSLTKEKYEELLKQLGDRKDELKAIRKVDHKDMYKDDLTELKRAINKDMK